MTYAYSNMIASFLFIFLFIKKMNGSHSSPLSCLAMVFNVSALLLKDTLQFSEDPHTQGILSVKHNTYLGKGLAYTFEATT